METLQGHKYLWKLPTGDTVRALDIAASYNLTVPVAQALVTRGYNTREEIDGFLFSTFERNVTHPSHLKDAHKAVERILQAIERKEKVLIFGDYDVDGITSSALMMICLLPLGAQVNFYLPNRITDGYGLSTKVVNRAAQNGYRLIITVDNGITAFEPAQQAKALGIDLIITDHHKPHAHVPEAYAIVNPHQNDCSYPFKMLAGVGVTFKLLTLLYEKKGIPLPVKVYELLLLGTVADVVPLLGENRFWVRHCLNYINTHESHSLRVLKANGKVTKPRMNASDIGFSIAPQINALGRLEDPRQGVQFLIGSDLKAVEQVGQVLLALNQARKEIERSVVAHIEREIAQGMHDIAADNLLLASSDHWPAGVIGLVASRMVGAYGKPTILLHITNKGIAKGSCRSIPEFNMFEALSSASHLLEQFGGHAQAAGLSLKIERIPELKAHLKELINKQLTPIDFQLKVTIDGVAQLSDFTQKMVSDLHHLEPFGHQNSTTVFHVPQVSLVQKPTMLKDAHVKCMIFAQGVIKPLIFFNRPDLYQLLVDQAVEPFDVAVQVNENHWNDRVSIELIGVDAARLGKP